MRRMQLMTVASLLTATLAVGWAYAQGGDAGRLTAQDYAEIQQLYSRYAQGTDLEDADMWLSVFAEDAVFRIGASGRSAALPAGEYVGHAELAEWRAQSFAGRDAGRQNRHWNSSWVITPTGDGTAEGRNYWLELDVKDDEAKIVSTGYYEDLYVKTADGWRIKQRHARPDPQ